MSQHTADAEAKFLVLNVTPDFCEVEGQVCPFDIARELSFTSSDFAEQLVVRGAKALRVGTRISGVQGNAGKGVITGVALGTGDTVIVTGSDTVMVKGRPLSRHDDLCKMNVT
ncbi:MAG: DUF4150 domain-containing protein [Sandaracinaceae bacterium]|nr:DUF4150 domain-containing protein [Sandaracinaceae bacterium]